MIKLNSKKFPDIFYESDKEIYYHTSQTDTPFDFKFDVSEDLTNSTEAMNLIGSFLDDIDNLKEQALLFVGSIITDKKHKCHDLVIYFFDEQKDVSVVGEEGLNKMFGTTCHISYDLMLKCLKVVRFGSYIDSGLNKQAFIMDLSFGRSYTDELLVIYFDTNKNIFCIAHES